MSYGGATFRDRKGVHRHCRLAEGSSAVTKFFVLAFGMARVIRKKGMMMVFNEWKGLLRKGGRREQI
jgi:hypothetical protein